MAIRDLVLTPCVICVVLAVAALAGESPKPAQGDSPGRLARLLKERRDVLQETVDAVTMRYKAGQGTCEAVVRANDRLLDAELELAATQEERIAAVERKVSNLLASEKYLEQIHKAGRTTRSELLETKASRLQAEIQLLRERSKVAKVTYDGRDLAEWRQLAVNDLNPETRAKAMQAFVAFARAGRDDALGAIRSALAKAEETTVVQAGYHALSQLGPAALPPLLEGLKSPAPSTRRIVARELRLSAFSKDAAKGPIPEEIVSALLNALKDPDASVRGEACHSLGYLGTRDSAEKWGDRIVPALIAALKDGSPTTGNISGYIPSTVQAEACRALGRWGAKAQSAVPVLCEILDRWGPVRSPRIAAIDALGEIGPAAKAALPTLEALDAQRPSYPGIRGAIEKIRGTHRGPRFSPHPPGDSGPPSDSSAPARPR